MKKYTTTWLLIISIFIAESHSYVGQAGEDLKNWGWTVKWNIPLKWHIKEISDEVNAIIYFVAMYFYTPNRVNTSTVLSFIILCFVDLVMYFHNFKTLYYGSVYAWILILWGLIFFSPMIKIKTAILWKWIIVKITNLWKRITVKPLKK